MTSKEALLAAADLLGKRGSWIRGELALDSDGEVCDPAAPEAVCWCVEGAIQRIVGHDWSVRNAALRRLSETVGEEDLGAYLWNDRWNTTRAKVIAALRKAAKAAS